MRAVRRLLWRAALLRWIRPRALKRSRMGWAMSNAALAPAASLASIALSTFLTAVRSIERWAALRALRTTACLARLLDDLMLATGNPGNLVCGRVLGSGRPRVSARADRKVWAIHGLASRYEHGSQARPVALDRSVQLGHLPVPDHRPGPGPGLCGRVRGQPGHGRLRGRLPD